MSVQSAMACRDCPEQASHHDEDAGLGFCEDHWDAYKREVMQAEYPRNQPGYIGHKGHTRRILYGEA